MRISVWNLIPSCTNSSGLRLQGAEPTLIDAKISIKNEGRAALRRGSKGGFEI